MVFLFSASDIALVLKYKFADETDGFNKKRKLTDNKRTISVLEYSQIKLPAQSFVEYLGNHLADFLNDCSRCVYTYQHLLAFTLHIFLCLD